MATFLLTCLDKPGALDLRMATREAHLAYIRAQADIVKLAGPFLGADDQTIGSLIIVETADLSAAQAFSAADPYAQAGVFQSVDIKPFKVTVGQL